MPLYSAPVLLHVTLLHCHHHYMLFCISLVRYHAHAVCGAHHARATATLTSDATTNACAASYARFADVYVHTHAHVVDCDTRGRMHAILRTGVAVAAQCVYTDRTMPTHTYIPCPRTVYTCVQAYQDIATYASMSGPPAWAFLCGWCCSREAKLYALPRACSPSRMPMSTVVLSRHDSAATGRDATIAARQCNCGRRGEPSPEQWQLHVHGDVPIAPIADTRPYRYTRCSTCSGMLTHVSARARGAMPLQRHCPTPQPLPPTDAHARCLFFCCRAHPPRRAPSCDVVHAPPSWANQLLHGRIGHRHCPTARGVASGTPC